MLIFFSGKRKDVLFVLELVIRVGVSNWIGGIRYKGIKE